MRGGRHGRKSGSVRTGTEQDSGRVVGISHIWQEGEGVKRWCGLVGIQWDTEVEEGPEPSLY